MVQVKYFVTFFSFISIFSFFSVRAQTTSASVVPTIQDYESLEKIQKDSVVNAANEKTKINLNFSKQCGLTAATETLEFINWQGKIDLLNSYGANYRLLGKKAIIVSGYLINQVTNSNGAVYTYFLIPLETTAGNNLKADFNKAIKSSTDFYSYENEIVEYNPLGITLLETVGESNYLYLFSYLGVKDKIGKVIVQELGEKKQKFVVQSDDGSLFLYDAKLGLKIPYINQTLKENIKSINFSAYFISQDRIIFSTSKSELCDNCSFKLSVIDKNKLVVVNAKLSKSKDAIVLASGEAIKIDYNGINDNDSSKSSWKVGLQDISVLKNGKLFIVFNQKDANYEGNVKLISTSSKSLFLKDTQDLFFYIINADLVKCDEEKSSIVSNLQNISSFDYVKTQLKGQTACDGTESNVMAWDVMNNKNYNEVILKSELTFTEIDYLLQRMLRNSDLSAKDIELLEKVFYSEFSEYFNDLLVLIVGKFKEDIRYRKLSLINRSLNKVKKIKGKLDNICFSQDVRKVVSKSYKDSIMNKIKSMALQNSTQNSLSLQKLLFIKPYLNILTDEDKNDIAMDSGTLIAEAIRNNDYNLRSVFFSTLDWFSTQKVKQLLNLKTFDLTDLILTNNDTYITIIGTQELFSESDFVNSDLKRNKGGFYAFDPMYFYVYDEGVKTVSWSHKEENFEGVITKKKRLVEFTPTLVDGPNKEEVLDDKVYHGLVAIGSNISKTIQDGMLKSYIYYLKQQNFTVEKEVEINDPLLFLKQGISGTKDKLDFFMKEAHSDGDYRNLFSINKKMFLVRAKLEHSDYTEIIDLFYHDGSYNPLYISNQEFANWLKIREDEKLGGQFLYLNTSCSSYTKAAQELGIAASKNLVIIASSTTVSTFTVNQTNSTYQLFDGIRKMMSFSEIAQTSKGLKGTYIFPKEDAYKTYVLNNISAGFQVTTKVFKINEEGERVPYEIEQVLNYHRVQQ
ncbi:MAG: hypothetical protein L6Q37_09235 [Bdellovibrionaceae bacterium]|nr:hypothetical protein [Pseudobdellovibrionaceae bacterium]NUM57330.1 hypothetical protein [Pseudobdellovibrionaceae bacterium]